MRVQIFIIKKMSKVGSNYIHLVVVFEEKMKFIIQSCFSKNANSLKKNKR